MTTLPVNTLLDLTPPPDATRSATLGGIGTSKFAARRTTPRGKYQWLDAGATIQMSNLRTGAQPGRPVTVTISPDGTWRASDGSSADVSVTRTYASPDGGGADWTLYTVTRSDGDGILGGVIYIQRIMTHGGAPPAKAPTSNEDQAEAPLEAQYVLFRKPTR